MKLSDQLLTSFFFLLFYINGVAFVWIRRRRREEGNFEDGAITAGEITRVPEQRGKNIIIRNVIYHHSIKISMFPCLNFFYIIFVFFNELYGYTINIVF